MTLVTKRTVVLAGAVLGLGLFGVAVAATTVALTKDDSASVAARPIASPSLSPQSDPTPTPPRATAMPTPARAETPEASVVEEQVNAALAKASARAEASADAAKEEARAAESARAVSGYTKQVFSGRGEGSFVTPTFDALSNTAVRGRLTCPEEDPITILYRPSGGEEVAFGGGTAMPGLAPFDYDWDLDGLVFTSNVPAEILIENPSQLCSWTMTVTTEYDPDREPG